MVKPLVAEKRDLIPVEAEEQGPASDPFITVVFNGVPMRFRAGGLRPALANTLLAIQANLTSNASDPKTRVLASMLKQVSGLALPMLRGVVNAVRNDARTPAAIRRSLPPLPPTPAHADRVVFLMTWLAEVAHAALTENAYVLDVVDDAPGTDSDVMKVARFGAADPYELPAEAESESDTWQSERSSM